MFIKCGFPNISSVLIAHSILLHPDPFEILESEDDGFDPTIFSTSCIKMIGIGVWLSFLIFFFFLIFFLCYEIIFEISIVLSSIRILVYDNCTFR